ncbi:hypothetical protein D3C78_1703590 [compost metagenome]
MEKHLFKPCIEIVAPAQVEAVEQGQQQLLAQGDGGVQRHGLVELLVECPLREGGDSLD